MPKPRLFLALPILALLLSFTRPAQAQYVVGGPNINLGTATAGTPWTATINIGGSCNGQYANAYNGGNPPPGIVPNPTQVGTVITFSGTPAASGTYTWNADLFVPGYACGFHDYLYSLTLTVKQPVTITTTTLPGTPAGNAYSTSLSATGGTPGYAFSLTSGSLPTGLSLSAAGTIAGTPTTAGTYPFTAKVTDSASGTATQALSITITASLSIATVSFPNASYGAGYSQGLSASGGTPGYSWAIISGSLPAGLSLVGATITGTPSATGNASLTVRATDSSSPTPQSATQTLTLHVNALPSVGVDSTEIFWGGGGPQAAGTSTAYYASTPQVFGPAYPFTAFAAGPDAAVTTVQVLLDGAPIATPPYGTASRPDGCSALGGPAWPGCPSIGLSYNFPASSYSLGAHTLSFRATDTNGLVGTASFPITIVSTLAITTATLPNGAVNGAYSQTVTATAGTPPYRWTLASGSLPTGLSLSAAGALSGSATTSSTFNFTLTATDSTSPTAQAATKALSISISSPLSVTTASLPAGLATTAYSQTLTAAGGTPGYTWSLALGSLPAGLTLNTSGNLFGTPTTPGTSNFTVQATDNTSPTAQTATAGALDRHRRRSHHNHHFTTGWPRHHRIFPDPRRHRRHRGLHLDPQHGRASHRPRA